MFRRVPIPVSHTVLLAREFRDQAVRAYGKATGGHSVLLSGREEDGSVARGHTHAYYLPQPTRTLAGFLERFVVVLPDGELGVAQRVLDAILGVSRLLRRDTYPVLVVPEVISPAPTHASSTRWKSLTPFLPPLQHRARRERTDPVQQMLRAVEECVRQTPTLISMKDPQVIPVLSHLYAVPGHARKPRARPRLTRRAGFALHVEFSEPVRLPTAIGADAHFGLGQFAAADAPSRRVHPR
jgi:CRISPR-associated protein Csb2